MLRYSPTPIPSRGKKPVFIYFLSDPRNPVQRRYVGSSSRPKDRLKSHISQCIGRLSTKDQWIQSLLRDNVKPVVTILDECSAYDRLNRERSWISRSLAEGHKLLNIADGGNAKACRRYVLPNRPADVVFMSSGVVGQVQSCLFLAVKTQRRKLRIALIADRIRKANPAIERLYSPIALLSMAWDASGRLTPRQLLDLDPAIRAHMPNNLTPILEPAHPILDRVCGGEE